MDTEKAITFLLSNGYLEPRVLPDGRFAAIYPLLFTAAIVTFSPQHVHSWFDERWCFHDKQKAIETLRAWNGVGDPDGWHRHLPSNRRRVNADPLREYIEA